MNNQSAKNNMHGFTLVELMIVVFLTAIAVIAIYRGYTAFSHSVDAQEQTIEMQQNLRIGMYWLEKDLMRAGMTEEDKDRINIYNKLAGQEIIENKMENKRVEEVAFLIAEDSTVEFGMDLGSGGVFATDGEDNDNDGIDDDDTDPEVAEREAQEESRMGDGDFNDEGERIIYTLNGSDLQRWEWNGVDNYKDDPATIITNVEALRFVYLSSGDPKATPPVPPERFVTPLNDADRQKIDTIEIALVVRTTNEDYRYTNNESYSIIVPPPGEIVSPPPPWDPEEVLSPQGDNFRRRLLVKRIKIRNAGL